MRLRRYLGALCAAVAGVLGGCGGDESARPDLAFVSTRDGDYAIFEMNADGGAQHRLTPREDGGAESPARLFFQIEPAWSPDASKIAFASRRSGTFDVYVMRADGTGTTQLTSGRSSDSHPTWSADGERIAFERDDDIYVIAADGAGTPRLISDANVEEREPAWSPDGLWIAYVRRTPGTTIREIWVMRPDGSGRRALTSARATVATPAWSPDSKTVVFASKPGEIFALFTVGLDGKRSRPVIPTATDNFEPSWSPDGTRIAYYDDGAIFTVELGTRAVEKLTDSSNNDSSPAWNPRPPPAD